MRVGGVRREGSGWGLVVNGDVSACGDGLLVSVQVNAQAECLHVQFYSSLTVSQMPLLIIFSSIHQKIKID